MNAVEFAERVVTATGFGALAAMAVVLALRLVVFCWIVLFGQTVRVTVHRPDGTKEAHQLTVSRDDDLIEILDDATRGRR